MDSILQVDAGFLHSLYVLTYHSYSSLPHVEGRRRSFGSREGVLIHLFTNLLVGNGRAVWYDLKTRCNLNLIKALILCRFYHKMSKLICMISGFLLRGQLSVEDSGFGPSVEGPPLHPSPFTFLNIKQSQWFAFWQGSDHRVDPAQPLLVPWDEAWGARWLD